MNTKKPGKQYRLNKHGRELFAMCQVTEDYQRRRAKNKWKGFTSHTKRRQRLSRTLWFRNLQGLNVSCGTEQVSVLFWSVLKTKRYTVQWVRDRKDHVHGFQYYNFRHVFEPSKMSVHQSKLTLRWLMSYIYGAPILDVSRSHTTTQHSR